MNKKGIFQQDSVQSFRATLVVNDDEIRDLPCKIHFPERTDEKPAAVFSVSEEQLHQMASSYKGVLRAAIHGLDNEVKTRISAPEAYFAGSSVSNWGTESSEVTVQYELQDLHVVQNIADRDGQDKTHVVFWLSPNKLLAPYLIRSDSIYGEISYKRVSKVEFRLVDDVQIAFDKNFRSKINQDGDLIQWSFLVAYADLDIPAGEVEKLKADILPKIDDLLLVASFAARERTVCLGWTATDRNSYATFYRGNYTFPEKIGDLGVGDRLVDPGCFERFMMICHASFARFENKLAIRHALYSAIPSAETPVETSFLQLFSGLEALVLDFRRREGLEFSLSQDDDWPELKKSLKKCIRESSCPQLTSKKRSSIYSKLDELNRISFRCAFNEFREKYAIDLTDLWSLFGEKKKTVGLSDIRNRLIHGDPLPEELLGVINCAHEHLKYTLERTIVRVLEWDVADTKVSRDYLGRYVSAIDHSEYERARLIKYVNDYEDD